MKSIRFFGWAVALGLMVTSLSAETTQSQAQVSDADLKVAAKISEELSQKEVARLLIFAALLATEFDEVSEISPAVRTKYKRMVNSVLAPIPLTLGGAVTYYFSGQSLEGALKELFSAISRSLRESSKQSARLLDNEIFRWSSRTSEKIWDQIWAVVGPLLSKIFNKHVGLSSLTLGSSGSLSMSVYLFWNETESALGSEKMRALLGYSREVDERLTETIDDLGVVYRLSADQAQILKEALKEEILKTAEAQNFRNHTNYEVDVLKVMSNAKLIDPNTQELTKQMGLIYKQAVEGKIPVDVTKDQGPQLRQNIETIGLLGSVIEQYLIDEKLTEARAKEAKSILYSLERTMRIMKQNFQ